MSTRAIPTLRHEESTVSSFFGPLGKVVYGLSSISMICVQNGPLSCKNSSPECTNNRYFETKNGKFFRGEGTAPSPYPFPSGRGTPRPHAPFPRCLRRLDCRAYDAPTSRLRRSITGCLLGFGSLVTALNTVVTLDTRVHWP